MKDTVMIKGTKSGIILVLDESLTWENLKEQVAERFKTSAAFLGEAQKAIAFQGRELTLEEQQELIEVIHDNCQLKIMCVLEEDPKVEQAFAAALDQNNADTVPKEEEKPLVTTCSEIEGNSGFFFKGNLRSGQVLDVETSIIVLGDVNNGAKVISKGNIIILGSLKGNVFAGSAGNVDAFVVALDMNPVQIRIADTIARSPDAPQKNQEKETKIAFWEDGNIYIEPLDKEVMSDIRLS